MAPQITLFGHQEGRAPTPLIVAILLEELKIDYVITPKAMGVGPGGMEADDYLRINPNGRVPTVIDHTSNDKVVWESGAILLYLAERFDPSGRVAGESLEEKSEVWEWLFYQASGLSPTLSQVNWCLHRSPEKFPSMIEKYQNEANRICGVLEKRLADQGEWLVLNRVTIADIAYFPWLNLIQYAEIDLKKYPNLVAYHTRIQALHSVKQAYLRTGASK